MRRNGISPGQTAACLRHAHAKMVSWICSERYAPHMLQTVMTGTLIAVTKAEAGYALAGLLETWTLGSFCHIV